jgi:phosphorylcholine metabolism protein LicD
MVMMTETDKTFWIKSYSEAKNHLVNFAKLLDNRPKMPKFRYQLMRSHSVTYETIILVPKEFRCENWKHYYDFLISAFEDDNQEFEIELLKFKSCLYGSDRSNE